MYIQARKVDAEALRAFASSGVNPPDMILFPPGLLDEPEALAAVGELPALRAGLAACADGYAAPVLMGGYAWVYDRQALEGPPAEEDTVACAPAGAYSSPPAALMLLSTGTREAEVELEAPGLDLGLPASAEVGKASPVNEDAYGAFTRGEVPALVATQAEARRLTALAETGRGPDWAAAATGEAMLADQLLLLGIVDWPRADIAERQTLCREFLLHLLDAETQAALDTCGALPVIEGLSVYGGENGYAALEAAASLPLLIPPVFGDEGQETLSAVSAAFLNAERSTRRRGSRVCGRHLRPKALPPRQYAHALCQKQQAAEGEVGGIQRETDLVDAAQEAEKFWRNYRRFPMALAVALIPGQAVEGHIVEPVLEGKGGHVERGEHRAASFQNDKRERLAFSSLSLVCFKA